MTTLRASKSCIHKHDSAKSVFLCHFRVSICIFLLLHASQSATPWETGPTPASWWEQRGERGNYMCFNTTIQTLDDKKATLTSPSKKVMVEGECSLFWHQSLPYSLAPRHVRRCLCAHSSKYGTAPREALSKKARLSAKGANRISESVFFAESLGGNFRTLRVQTV